MLDFGIILNILAHFIDKRNTKHSGRGTIIAEHFSYDQKLLVTRHPSNVRVWYERGNEIRHTDSLQRI